MYSLQKSLQTVHPQPLPWLEALWGRPMKPLSLQQQRHKKKVEKWPLLWLQSLSGRPAHISSQEQLTKQEQQPLPWFLGTR